MAITTSGTSITFNDSTTQTTAYQAPNVQTFNSSGTWTKPTGYSMARIDIWAGGGGGNRSGSNNATGSGGGGAGYNTVGGFKGSQGSGGSGVVILSVPTIFYSGTTTGSPTITTSGSNTIIKWTTGSGTYTA
mgnify:CR=1 FL=1